MSDAHEALLREREALNNLQASGVGVPLRAPYPPAPLCLARRPPGRALRRPASPERTPVPAPPYPSPPRPLNAPQDQHEQLLRAQEVLQAELSMALGSYQPKATIDAGTPADTLLAMMTELLDGSLPNLQDILTIQSTILEVRRAARPGRRRPSPTGRRAAV